MTGPCLPHPPPMADWLPTAASGPARLGGRRLPRLPPRERGGEEGKALTQSCNHNQPRSRRHVHGLQHRRDRRLVLRRRDRAAHAPYRAQRARAFPGAHRRGRGGGAGVCPRINRFHSPLARAAARLRVRPRYVLRRACTRHRFGRGAERRGRRHGSINSIPIVIKAPIAGPGGISVVDATTGRGLRTAALGVAPQSLALDDRAQKLFIGDGGDPAPRQAPDPWAWLPAQVRRRVPFLPQHAPASHPLTGLVLVLDASHL